MLDTRRLTLLVMGAVIALAAGWLRTLVPAHAGYLSILIVTIFSIMAGFLSVALNMILVSSPVRFRSPKSRKLYQQHVRGRVMRHSLLFYCYLVILFTVFVSELVAPVYPGLGHGLEIMYVGFSAAALFWSFSIPRTIAKLHEEQSQLAAIAEIQPASA